jgi:GNAT superfamily N-acetyltransferase
MTGMRLRERRVTEADAALDAAVQALFESNEAYCRAADELDPDGRVAPDHARRFLAEELGLPGGRVHVYEDGPDVVAVTAELVPHPREPYPWIGLLLVHGGRHGEGLGRRCADLVHDRLAAEGWSEVRLAVLERNPDALVFWQRLGYEICDARPDTEGRPCTVLRRSLATPAGPVAR